MDVGSVADWVQAVGGLAGLATALTIAFVEHRRAKRAEATEKRRFEELLHEGMGQIDRLQHVFTRVFELGIGGRQPGYDSAFDEHETTATEVGRKLSALSGLAAGEPSLAVVFSDCAAIASPIGRAVPWEVAHELVRRNANYLMLQHKALAEIAGHPSEERWLVDPPTA